MVSLSPECCCASATLGTSSLKNYGVFVLNSGLGRNCHSENEYNNTPLPNSDVIEKNIIHTFFLRHSGTAAVEVTHKKESIRKRIILC